MCVQCSRCKSMFYCGFNTVVVHVPAQKCPANFNYVSSCKDCWAKEGLIGWNAWLVPKTWSTQLSVMIARMKKSVFIVKIKMKLVSIVKRWNDESQQNLLYRCPSRSSVAIQAEPICHCLPGIEDVPGRWWWVFCPPGANQDTPGVAPGPLRHHRATKCCHHCRIDQGKWVNGNRWEQTKKSNGLLFRKASKKPLLIRGHHSKRSWYDREIN